MEATKSETARGIHSIDYIIGQGSRAGRDAQLELVVGVGGRAV
jgi:hypothetical protein